MTGINPLKKISAARVVASTTGTIAGLGGMEHGLFAMLQGNLPTGGRVIDAIGPAQRMWVHGSEPAFTLLPNFLATGILAIILGLLVIIWSLACIDRKHAAWVLLLLSIILFLVGGGFAPPFYALLAIIAAFKIGRPLTLWRRFLPAGVRSFLARSWLWFLIPCASLASLLIVQAIFGYPLLWFVSADVVLAFNSNVGFFTFFALGPLVIVSAFAHDAHSQAGSAQTTTPGSSKPA